MKARLIFLLSIKIVIISIFFACSSSPKETEKTSSLCYRSAFYVADDGWVYEFDNQYRSDVPMKDSGIEWIGMIPEHWGVAKLANLFTSLGGYAFNSDLYVSETENLIVRIGNVKNDRLLFDANPVYISDDLAEQVIKFKMQCGDILFTMTGTKGKRDYFYTLILDNSHIQTKNLYLNQRVGCFRKKAHIHAEYYNYLLKDNRILDSIFLYETGTANQGNLGIDSINRTKVHLPPYDEQITSVSGKVFLKVYKNDVVRFDEVNCTALFCLPIKDVSVVVEELPIEISVKGYDGKVESKIKIEEVSYSFDKSLMTQLKITIGALRQVSRLQYIHPPPYHLQRQGFHHRDSLHNRTLLHKSRLRYRLYPNKICYVFVLSFPPVQKRRVRFHTFFWSVWYRVIFSFLFPFYVGPRFLGVLIVSFALMSCSI